MIKKNNIQEYLSPMDLEKQESLSLERLKKLTQCTNEDSVGRPPANFIDLMNWVSDKFSRYLEDSKDLEKFIHNRIIIDGQFLQFCEENNIKVECLYKDSFISWKTDHKFEKFFAQGVFRIYNKDVQFLHAALFHKGNQQEDEISFFVVVSQKYFNKYVEMRNSFDDWMNNRDRSNLHIRVIDGEDIPYTKDSTWEELFLPQEIKTSLKDSVETFLLSKDFYLEKKIAWKKGILLYGQPGCHIKGTPIIMSDGSIKNVEDVKVGDFLLGPDGKPREVFKLVRGNEQCFEITPKKGDSFIVNENHILHLCYSSNSQKNLPKYLDLSVKELLTLSKPLQERLKLRKSQCIDFNINNSLPIDPYMLGLWLGDGTVGEPEITSADLEIINYCEEYAKSEGLTCKISPTKSKCFTIRFSRDKKIHNRNPFNSKLKALGIFNKKLIPQQYLTASVEDRFKLLAGLIDSDGSHNIWSSTAFSKFGKVDRKKGNFDFIQKDLLIMNQIGFLARSLGLGFTNKLCQKRIKKTGFVGNYYRSSIYGDIYKIPTLLPRKQAGKGYPNKDPLNIGIKSIKSVGNNNYYGFTIDQDHLYMTGDFFIHHNCGKTSVIRTIISQYNFKPVTFIPGANAEAMREAFSYAEEQNPALLYIEDLDSLIENGLDTSSFLNLLDGISSKNGILVIATANDINKLKSNITRRPSRFDRKIEIPTPNQEMAYIYLNKWFGKTISSAKCRELAKTAEKHQLSYAYLKELYISSMFEAIANNRKSPTMKDIDNTLNRLIREKNSSNNGIEINTDKYFKQ